MSAPRGNKAKRKRLSEKPETESKGDSTETSEYSQAIQDGSCSTERVKDEIYQDDRGVLRDGHDNIKYGDELDSVDNRVSASESIDNQDTEMDIQDNHYPDSTAQPDDDDIISSSEESSAVATLFQKRKDAIRANRAAMYGRIKDSYDWQAECEVRDYERWSKFNPNFAQGLSPVDRVVVFPDDCEDNDVSQDLELLGIN